jgi:bifunctional UDP-N-acetylglucosamine pyrophosphorylase/glucosamine-1-phosphate N-acetyltransferase
MPARALTVILAAGEGKRMYSVLPKVLHRVGKKPLVEHLVQASLKSGLGRVIVVVGHRRDMVIESLVDYPIEYVVQADQRGTGHAMQMVAEYVGNYDGSCLVLPGDAPFVRPETMRRLVEFHESGNYAATLFTAEITDPEGYGRVVRDATGDVARIVEHGDAKTEELSIREVNSSIYVFDYRQLVAVLARLQGDNRQGELYLTDTIGFMRQSGGRVGAIKAEDAVEAMGINDHAQLKEADRIYRERQPPEPPKRPRPQVSFDEDEDEDEMDFLAGSLTGVNGAEADTEGIADDLDHEPEESPIPSDD